MALAPDTLLNSRYRIEDVLGQGGMGSIYRAKDETLGIEVAVKENLYLTEEYLRQFQREATILARVKHFSLPRVIDYFLIPNQGQYLVMDYIPGEDLRDRIERLGKVPEREIITIGAMICDALDYLHRQEPPIIHRDIKPGNIKITPEGTIALVDFGLAKMMIENQQTTTGARAMTPGYSPPEQYGTAPTDGRTDIYSLGATLYAALTGIIPEDGIGRATGRYELTPVRDLDPDVNRKLAAALEKSMELKPEDRFQTPADFKAALLASAGLTSLPIDSTIAPAPSPQTDIPSDISAVPADQNAEPVKTARIPMGAGGRRKAKPYYQDPKWIAVMTLIALALIFLVKSLADSRLNVPPSPTPLPVISATEEQQASSTPSNEPTETPRVAADPTQADTPTVTLALPTPPPTPEVERGLIAFASDRTGTMEIWLMKKDGSNQRALTNLPDGACQPAWSPDGTKIAFISPCKAKRDFYPNSKIFILDLLSNAPAQELNLPPSPRSDFEPAWSPDGKRIAFASNRSGNLDIYTFNLEDGSLVQLTDSGYSDRAPAWSPSGNLIAYAHDAIYSQIWIMTDTGHNKVRLDISGQIDAFEPTWSPDGNFVFFTLADGSPSWLVSMRYEDRGTNLVTRIPELGQPDIVPVASPSVSPDGKLIVFESWPQGTNHDIYLVTITGSNRIRLTTDKDFDFDPMWQP